MDETIYTLVSWKYFKDIIKQRFSIDFTRVDDFFTNGVYWHRFNNWDTSEDLEIFNAMENLKTFQGKLLVVTDSSYKNDLSPFMVDGINMRQFVDRYWETVGDCFFDTDVLIVNVEDGLAWIFHHEGVYALINLD